MVAKCLGELQRLFHRAVGDCQDCRLLRQQWLQRAPRRASRTHQQHPLAGDAETEIAGDVADEAGAVGIIGADAPAGEVEEIRRLRFLGALRYFVGQVEGFKFERHSHVCAPAARRTKVFHGAAKAVGWRQQARVFDILSGLARKRRVNLR
jgi:hypothetical protein